MSTETTEFVTFNCTEAVRKQPEVSFKPVVSIVRGVPGLISTYAGLAVEDETRAFILTRWASLQAHIDFTKSPLFDELKEALGKLLAGPLVVEHVDFRKNTAESLAAPITEIARFTLKAGHTKEQLVPLLDQLGEITTVPFVAQTWGWCVENNDQAVVAIGWKSVEAHLEAFQNLPESIRELNGKALEHVDIAVVHAHALTILPRACFILVVILK